jgi:H+-translocating NAD(P) transhydrogenase subunit alpha
MIVAVPREAASNERRVALVPETVTKLIQAGASVRVQHDAGTAAAFPNAFYTQAGASIVDDPAALVSDADLVVTVGKPAPNVLAAMRKNATLVGFLNPLGDPAYVETLKNDGITALAMEMIPRITRAQSMDALSSQSNIAGYKAVLLGAEALPKFFPMLTTAAGTIPPAKALILGAGVAGLQAIATARRLGAVVSAYDVRAVVKEQIQSLGATFLEFDLGESAEGGGGYAKELTPEQQARQQAWMVEQIGKNDVVITTALVPGRKAPILVSDAAIAAMKPGSVIVDIAAETGGNTTLTKAGETVVSPNGVNIIGAVNLPSTMPYNASQLYSRNVYALISPFIKDGKLELDFEDEVIKGARVA